MLFRRPTTPRFLVGADKAYKTPEKGTCPSSEPALHLIESPFVIHPGEVRQVTVRLDPHRLWNDAYLFQWVDHVGSSVRRRRSARWFTATRSAREVPADVDPRQEEWVCRSQMLPPGENLVLLVKNNGNQPALYRGRLGRTNPHRRLALRPRVRPSVGSCAEAGRMFVPIVESSPAHMVRSTVCGHARRQDRLVSNWPAVTCAACLRSRPAAAWCLHCHQPVRGSCLRLARVGAWLHATCSQAFERSPLCRALLAAIPDLFQPARCSRCGRPRPESRLAVSDS